VGVPQALVRIDRQKAADLGVSVRRVAETLETALGGTRAGADGIITYFAPQAAERLLKTA